MKLLIVDDEDIIREGIVEKIAWKENGFTLTTPGKNGLDAKEIIERERPDIVLTDINMPFINGLELAAWIREEYPDIKIIFLTGYDEFQYAKKAIQLKASAYILKYEKQEILLQEIKSVAELLERERAGERLLDQAIRQQAVETVSDLIIGFARNSDRQSVLKKMGWKKEAAAYYFVILDVALNTPVDEDKPNENGLYLFSYINAAKEVSEAHCATVVCGSYDNQVFVIFAQEENERDFYKHVKETAEEIIVKFQEFLKVEAWAGISDVYDDIFQTDMAYNSAYMALQLAKGHGNKRIVCTQTSDNGIVNGNGIMQEIAEYIHQNYTIAGLSLNDLSEAIHLSPSHLCRLIKKYENTNFMVWLTKVRVKMAAELIRTTDMKVYEICEKVGYNNPQYFSVVFKKYMGCSPRDYK